MAVQGTDVPAQPAADLTFVREDVTGHPAVAGRPIWRAISRGTAARGAVCSPLRSPAPTALISKGRARPLDLGPIANATRDRSCELLPPFSRALPSALQRGALHLTKYPEMLEKDAGATVEKALLATYGPGREP